MQEARLAAVASYRTSPLFTDAERVALDFAAAAAAQPNAVTDELFESLKQAWSETQIVEIVAVVSLFGFMNRWHGSLATPLEAEPLEAGEKHLAAHGWRAGKHA